MQFNKFVFGGILILGAVVFLIWSSTAATQEYFLTIDELNAKGSSVVDKNLRVSGAVIGDTIQYDPQSLTLSFEVAHVAGDNADLETEGGLAVALHQAVIDPSRSRVKVVYVGPKPDLLRNEAQARIVCFMPRSFYSNAQLATKKRCLSRLAKERKTLKVSFSL
jgi:cytochrome c-type biogenesis protein CcmE